MYMELVNVFYAIDSLTKNKNKVNCNQECKKNKQYVVK